MEEGGKNSLDDSLCVEMDLITNFMTCLPVSIRRRKFGGGMVKT